MKTIYWIIIIIVIIVLINRNNNFKNVNFKNHISYYHMDELRDIISNITNINDLTTDNIAFDNIIQYCINSNIWKYYYQRPAYYIPNLSAKPIWNKNRFNFVKTLENNFKEIEDDINDIEINKDKLNLMTKVNEKIYDGKWNDLFFYSNGIRNNKTCKTFPKIAKIIDGIKELQGVNPGCVCLSFIYPGTKVLPHFGTSNNKLRLHLGIKNLEGSTLFVKGRSKNKNVITHKLKWEKGKVFIFDDSFEHWVENQSKKNKQKPRIILLADLWHPDLNKKQIKEMSKDKNIFFNKYPFFETLIKDMNIQTISKQDVDHVMVRLNRYKQNEIGKYMIKNGVKHFTKDANNNIKLTYENGKIEIFKQ